MGYGKRDSSSCSIPLVFLLPPVIITQSSRKAALKAHESALTSLRDEKKAMYKIYVEVITSIRVTLLHWNSRMNFRLIPRPSCPCFQSVDFPFSQGRPHSTEDSIDKLNLSCNFEAFYSSEAEPFIASIQVQLCFFYVRNFYNDKSKIKIIGAKRSVWKKSALRSSAIGRTCFSLRKDVNQIPLSWKRWVSRCRTTYRCDIFLFNIESSKSERKLQMEIQLRR